jgi:hypothetical protein
MEGFVGSCRYIFRAMGHIEVKRLVVAIWPINMKELAGTYASVPEICAWPVHPAESLAMDTAFFQTPANQTDARLRDSLV